MAFQRRRRHLERYMEIGRILAKHGWESFLVRTGLADLFHVRGKRGGIPPEPVQVRATLEELGPAFIKLGQVLSTRPDLLPVEYVTELEKLQDEARQISFAESRLVIEEEFGIQLKDIFATFDPVPLAAASLGQTYTATLQDGTEVVVKVQRPGVRDLIEKDLEILSGAAKFIEHHFDQIRTYSLPDLIDEFSITIRNELDYTREGRNGDLLREALDDVEYVAVARTMWDHTTCRVLTSERIHGIKITDTKALIAKGLDLRVIARNLSRVFLRLIFVDGFFHADPHPGNIIVKEGNVIGLLDYGMIGRLDRDLKSGVTMLLANYVDEDSRGFSETLQKIGSIPEDLNRREFTADVDRLLRQYYGAPLREMRVGDILRRSIELCSRFGIQLPASLGLLIKVILGVEGINRRLDPDFDLSAEAKPFIKKAFRSELTASEFARGLSESLIYWKSLVLSLPNRTSQVLDRMAEGNFRVVFRHEGLEKPSRDIDRSANRLSLAMISSATIIASSVILSANVGPYWGRYPMVGLIGFILSFVFALWLMISIIRAGRLW